MNKCKLIRTNLIRKTRFKCSSPLSGSLSDDCGTSINLFNGFS